MAITAKPTDYSVNTGHAKCPTHLYMFDGDDVGTTVVHDQGKGTHLDLTLTSAAMWGTDALGDVINCSQSLARHAVSATGTLMTTDMLLVALIKTASSTNPTVLEYIIGVANNSTLVAYGGMRASDNGNGVMSAYWDSGTDTMSRLGVVDFYDQTWRMASTKYAANKCTVSGNGGAWSSDSAPTCAFPGNVNRYGIGARPAPTSGLRFNGAVLAAFIYEDLGYTNIDNAWIADLYDNPWQFLASGGNSLILPHRSSAGFLGLNGNFRG